MDQFSDPRIYDKYKKKQFLADEREKLLKERNEKKERVMKEALELAKSLFKSEKTIQKLESKGNDLAEEP